MNDAGVYLLDEDAFLDFVDQMQEYYNMGGLMMNTNYYVNVARTMGILPRPRRKCTLHVERAETICELPIIKIQCELNCLDLEVI